MSPAARSRELGGWSEALRSRLCAELRQRPLQELGRAPLWPPPPSAGPLSAAAASLRLRLLAARPAEARTLWGFLSAGEGVSPTLVPASHGKFQAARNAPGAERVRDLTR